MNGAEGVGRGVNGAEAAGSVGRDVTGGVGRLVGSAETDTPAPELVESLGVCVADGSCGRLVDSAETDTSDPSSLLGVADIDGSCGRLVGSAETDGFAVVEGEGVGTGS